MTSLLATGVYGIVKTVFSMLFLLWVIDRVGRRPTLLVGGLVMAAVMLINACVLATKPIDETSSDVSSASIGMIVLIYIFCITYSGSWGPGPWTYIG
jgi:MFS family permease